MPNYTSRDRHKTQKPLFPQLETTTPLKKLKIEETIFPNSFEVSGKSLSAEKCKKGEGPFGIFWTSILLQNIKKLKDDPLETIKKCEKSLTKPK